MTKDQVADILTEIATLLELKGENPFKVRAYAAGARGFLIGESLMRTSEKSEMIRTLRGGGVPA